MENLQDQKHIAIAAICKIINGIPSAEMKQGVIHLTCMELDRSPDLTGIPFSEDRPLKHFMWDLELENLADRMIDLVENVGLGEKFIVLGVIGYVDATLAGYADFEIAQRGVEANESAITRMKRQQLPDEQWKREQIADLIQKLEAITANAEIRRSQAEESLYYFRQQIEETFTLKYWQERAKREFDQD